LFFQQSMVANAAGEGLSDSFSEKKGNRISLRTGNNDQRHYPPGSVVQEPEAFFHVQFTRPYGSENQEMWHSWTFRTDRLLVGTPPDQPVAQALESC
jgi:hypothetical protein